MDSFQQVKDVQNSQAACAPALKIFIFISAEGKLSHKCLPTQGGSFKGNIPLQFFLTYLGISQSLCLINDVRKPVHLSNFIPLV